MTNRAFGPAGRKVGYTCSCVPEEIIRAASCMPVRVIPDTSPSGADGYIHLGTCGYLKSLLACGLHPTAPGMAAMVFANCCDGMRRLFDLWEQYVPGTPPVFLEVRKKRDRSSEEFFAAGLRRFAGKMRDSLGLRASLSFSTSGVEPAGRIRGFP